MGRPDGSGKRQAVDIIADTVQFLGSRDGSGQASGNGFTPQSDVPTDTSDFEGQKAPAAAGAASGGGDDDIPF